MKNSIVIDNIKYNVLFSYEKNKENYLVYTLNEKDDNFTKVSIGKLDGNNLLPITDEEDYSMIEGLIKKFEVKESINEKE